MGFSAAAKAVLLLQLSLLLLSSFTVSAQIVPEALPPHYHGVSPVMAPSHPPGHHHHHHHHHHPHPHPPAPSPTKPPTHPPVHPPPKSPTPAPVYPPPKPPVHPPKPPVHPPPKTPTPVPVYPPPKPPVHPPPKPPVYPPPKPPVLPPPKPPVLPPPKPPVYPPPKPPVLPPPKPPVHPPPKPPVYPPPKPPVHPPPKPPAKPPVHPPPYPPTHPPAKPPTYPKPPPRSFVAVQGVVFCKSCKYAGVDTLLGAKPVFDASVKLACKNSKYKLVVQAKTDKNGYFYLQAPKTVTSFGAHKCTVSLVSSPLAACSKPSNLHGGLKGATLRPEKPFIANNIPFILYTVGPLAFEPKCY